MLSRKDIKTFDRNKCLYEKFCVQFCDSNWDDRRSRRLLLCFYSAIFQLTSAKFQTFAYTVTRERLGLVT